MATYDDVRSIAAQLPGAIESEDAFGFWVENKGKAKGFIWIWQERIDPKKPRVPNPGVLAIITPNLTAKDLLIATYPAKYFTEPHYNGFPAVLVRLDAVDREDLVDLVVEAWRSKAPTAVVAEYDASNGEETD